MDTATEPQGWLRGPEQTWAVDPPSAGEKPPEPHVHAWRADGGEQRTACGAEERVVFTNASVFDPDEERACAHCAAVVTGTLGDGATRLDG
ncbi:hypothetical protein [Actinomadura parmotrematis]|uniref:Uncharacterized protein n=1 Tax=Actinomadura parmotrematis TaxID=2864039 RepID=A0ABS7FZF4_9ACTN|nr:hypothetical protein [Actinomadura parmotrematis]MBW8485325.1 hypothetical protein [Actinomadura parmotrematis]